MDRLANYPMTEVIAHREYSLLGLDGPVPVVALLGRPALMLDSPHHDWYCPWQIECSLGNRTLFGAGVDSVQALLMAISMVRDELNLLARNGELTWLDQSDLNLSLY